MQAVAQLVGLHADEAGAGEVHRLVQLPLAHVVKNAAGELAELRRDEVDEGLAAADDVLVEAGDALVHGAAHVVRAVLVVKLLRLVLHEQRVAALVERGEDVGDEVLLVVVGGDAHVVRPVVVGEGVLGGHEHERALPQTLQLQQVAGHGLLLRDGHRAVQEILPDGLALLRDAPQERDDARLQRVEEGVELRDAAALLIVVETGVVIRGLLLVAQVDLLAGIADERGKGVPEQGEVVRLLGTQPVAVGAARGQIDLEGERGGDVLRARVAVVEVLDGLLLYRRQTLGVRVQLDDQLLVGFRVGQPVHLLAEDRDVLPGGGDALFGRAALHIELHFAETAVVDLDLLQKPGELFPFLLVGHFQSPS